DLAAFVGSSFAVELYLAVDLRTVEHGSGHDVCGVARELVLDRRHVGDGAPDGDQPVRRRPTVELPEIGGDRRDRRRHHAVGHGPIEAEPLGEAYGTDVDAESFLDAVVVTERELGAASAS